MKFKKKPVEINAVQWTGDNLNEIYLELCPEIELGVTIQSIPVIKQNGEHLLITTLEGVMMANINDWIIRGVAGEYYPCKPDIFEATYEEVKDG